jgi:hypothetical protein
VKQDFGNSQLKIINRCKIYLNKIKKKIPVTLSPFFYFTTWADTIGKVKLSIIINNFKFQYIKILFKNIFFLYKFHDLVLITSKNNFFFKKDFNIVVSYSTFQDFDSKGFFYDKYFNISSQNTKNTFWFLISLDNKIPSVIKENILIIKKKNINSYNYFYIFIFLFKILFSKKNSITNFFHFWNVEYNFSEKISKHFKDYFQYSKNIKNVILNYESIPFQNLLIETVKSINKNIKTYGYLHCAPWPLQTEFFYKGVKLDRLFVSGIDQKSVFIKHFGWNKKKISVIPSLRFDKKNKKQFNRYIFVPYNLNKNNNFINRFSTYLDGLKDYSLPVFKIRIHPLNIKSIIHIEFKYQLLSLLNVKKNKFMKQDSDLSIFFGSATGVCVQALEEEVKIIHFPENVILDAFTTKIWKNINIKHINEDILEYSIKKKSRLVNITNEKNKFKKYLIKEL